MPLLPEEWIQDLLGRISIRDIIEKYIPLEQKGNRYWACCPFHHEKTPSFSVTPDKGLFYCYGCHKGGNAITFVSEIERINFREACEKLAEGCGLEMPSAASSAQQQAARAKIEEIRTINRAAALFFLSQLFAPGGASALAYLRGRGLTDADIKRNGIGFAPGSWNALKTALTSRGFSEQQMIDAGLRGAGSSGSYDLFRGRVMFPIVDSGRNVIGFGGRVMDDATPKYLNTPVTAAFNKRRNLYHMNVVHQLGTLHRIMLMEGYMDVVAADRFGIRNTVATLGTALTEEQARLLKRLGVPVYISYDGDRAGINAALKATGILEAAGVTCRVLVLPDGMDPDEYLTMNGRDAFEEVLDSAMEPVPFRFSQIRRQLDFSQPEDKERYIDQCIGILHGLRSEVAKERYARMLAEDTGYSVRAILRDAEGEDAPVRPDYAASKRRAVKDGSNGEQRAEDYLAAYAVEFPDHAGTLFSALQKDDFEDEANAAIVASVAALTSRGMTPRPDDILAVLETEVHRNHAAKLLGSDLVHDTADANPLLYAQSCVTRLRRRREEKRLHSAMREIRQSDDPKKIESLKREVMELNRTIYRLNQDLRQPSARKAD